MQRSGLAGAPAVETSALTKVYRGGGGCREITLSIARGEVFGLLGPNGAGKSTLVKSLVGLVRPTGGRGTLFGHPIGSLEARRTFGFLPELFRYQEWMSGGELLDFHASLRRIPAAEVPKRRQAALDLVGLTGREHDRIGSYSKGMQQRIGLAVALLSDPPLLFLDEPTSALDPLGRHEVRRLIQNLKAAGKSVFLNSHLLSEVELVCDQVAIIDQGRIVSKGAPAALLSPAVEAELACDHYPEALLAKLRTLAQEVRLEEGRLRLTLRTQDDLPEVARVAVGEGVAVYTLRPVPPTLEEVFLRLVRGGDHPGTAL